MKKVVCNPTCQKIVLTHESEFKKWNEANPNEKGYIICDKKILEIVNDVYDLRNYDGSYTERTIDGQTYKIHEDVLAYCEKLLMSKAIKKECGDILSSLNKHTVYSFHHTYKYNGKTYFTIIDADIPTIRSGYIDYWFSTEDDNTKIFIYNDMYNKDTENPKDVIANTIATLNEHLDELLKDYLEKMEKLK